MGRVAALPVLTLLLATVPAQLWAQAQVPSSPDRATTPASILFWSSSRPFVDGWVRDVPASDEQRLARLSQLFVKDECRLQRQPVGKQGTNLICVLPGDTDEVVVVAAHYDHSGSGTGAVENWSGAALLPLLYHAMQAAPRHSTYIFVALDGERGARTFLDSRKGEQRKKIRAVLGLEDLGLGPARSCTFPDSSDRFLQDLGLEHALIGVGQSLRVRDMPQHEPCFHALRVDDTTAFRKAGIASMVIHSVTPEKLTVPFSEQDVPSAIDAASYYNSYQLVATYLCVLDQNLDKVLKLGGFDPIAEALSIAKAAPIPDADAAAPVNDLPQPSAAGRGGPESFNGRPRPGTVVLDVVAAGQDGVPVAGLARDDFEISEDGHPQQIASFEESHAGEPLPPAESGPGPKQSADYYTNAPTGLLPASTVVLVIDALNTPGSDLESERKSMVAYLKSIPPRAHVAVFGLGSRLWMFQGLETDSSALLAAVDRVMSKPAVLPEANANAPGSGPATGGGGQPASHLEKALTEFDADLPVTDCPAVASPPRPPSDSSASPIDFDKGAARPVLRCPYSLQTRMQHTTDGFRTIGRYLEGIPGRKSLVWFSESFPFPITPVMLAETTRLAHQSGQAQPQEDTVSLQSAIDQLANARVSLYPVDARGAIKERGFFAKASGPLASGVVEHEPYIHFFGGKEEQHSDMEQLAEAAGGVPFYKTEELRAALARAMLDNSRYYTVSYQSSNAGTAPGSGFRRIEVEAHKGSTLFNYHYRRGYFDARLGDSNWTPLKPDVPLTGDFAAALGAGLPPSMQILFNARAKRAPQQPLPGSVRYVLDYNARYGPAEFLDEAQPKGQLMFAVAADDAAGVQVQSLWRPLDLDLSAEGRAKLVSEGVRFQMEVDVPNSAATLTLGVYDPRANRIGTLDIPLDGERPAP